MTTASDEILYTGMLRMMASAIGWDKLKALVARLAAEDEEKKARGVR